jgi:hypothetical protein
MVIRAVVTYNLHDSEELVTFYQQLITLDKKCFLHFNIYNFNF